MKKSILLFAGLILFGLNSIAQNTYNVVVFSEEGDGFFAYVNGIRQNDKPETNVKITGLTAQALSLRIEFENQALPKLKQNLMGEPGFEQTVRIKTTMKKEKKLQYFGKVALADAPNSSASTVPYHTSENTEPLGTNSNNLNTAGNDGNTTITTTSTTTKINSNPNNVSLNINAGGAGISMNVNGLDGMPAEGTQNSTTSTTVTKTSYSSSSSSTSNGNANSSINNNNNTHKSSSHHNNNNVTTSNGCNAPMNSTSYDNMKKSIEAKPFSDTKMSTAKVATKNTCLSTAQIKGICSLFSMDDDKLIYAKYAYDYCTDKANFYQVSEIFSFSATTDDLNKFLEAK